MITKTTFFGLFFFTLLGNLSFSQVTVKLVNLTNSNGIPISDCGTIDMDIDPTVTINFSIDLQKPYNQVVGLSNLYAYYEGSSGTRSQIFHQIVQSNSWSSGTPNTYSTSGSFSLSASNFNASGGTVFAVFKTSSNVEYQSCSYSVVKTNSPTFTLSPSYYT